MIQYPISQKVFDCQDLVKIIFEFSHPKRCMECHQRLIYNDNESINVNKYWDYNWKRTKCRKYSGNICNWCYYYVWEWY
jgi:hypothetical protein